MDCAVSHFEPGRSHADPPPPHIALFMHDFARTGVVANAVRLANALAAAGRQVTLLVCSAQGREQHPIHPAVEVMVAAPPSMLRGLRRSLLQLGAVPALRRKLRELAPVILVSAGNHGHGTAALAAAGIPNLRLVLRISNELEHTGNSALKRRWRRAVQQRVLARADRVLLVSAHLARDPLLAAALARGKAVITPNGVDVERVRQLATAARPHPWIGGEIPVVVAVGRLAPHKNLDTLVRAVARAARERPLRLIIVGSGPATERARLLEVAREAGIAEAVHLHGESPNPFAFMARAAVFALPSLWEGSSNVLLEALACDVPIVAARSAGNAQEVLDHGRYGLLVDPHDTEAMAQAILLQASAQACRPGARAADFDAATSLARVCAAVVETGAAAP